MFSGKFTKGQVPRALLTCKLKSVLIPIALMFCSGVNAKPNVDCDVDFKMSQLWTMQRAFDYGAPDGMGHLLAAIVWKESSAGLKLHRKDGEHWSMRSYGPFHILLRTAKQRRGCSTWNCSNLKNRLLHNFEYSAELAVEELEYWRNRLGSASKALSAYNAGNNWNGMTGVSYRHDVVSKINYLKQCVRFD